MKKIYSFLLVLLMAVMSASVKADIVDYGTGWKVDKNLETEKYTLMITSSSALKNYSSASAAPWHSWRPYIKDIMFDYTYTGSRDIGSYCFCDMPLLEGMYFTGSIGEQISYVTIGAHAFENCPNLVTVWGDQFVVSFGDYAFKGCTSLWAIDWSESMYEIGAHAFEGCTALQMAASRSKAAFTVGEYAFKGCTTLVNADLLYAKSIGKYAFHNCSLVYATLRNCQTVGEWAFSLCNLDAVELGANLSSIGNGAFRYAINDKAEITAKRSTPPTLGSDVFEGVHTAQVYLFLADESYGNAYNKSPWNQFIRNAVGTTIYGVYSGTTLTLYCDDRMSSRGGSETWWNYEHATERGNATKVVLDASMKNAHPESTAGWFYNLENVTQIQNLDYLNTSRVTEMNDMFYQCKKLTSIDLSHFNTANVTNMNTMFGKCESLTSLDLNYLDMSEVTSVYSMFSGCKNLERLYCETDWNAYSSNIVISVDLFYNCTKLKGGNGTAYNKNNVDLTYARPDGATEAPGYFWRSTDDGLNHQGIEDVQVDNVQSTKVIRDGQLFIIRDGKTFNALGVEVK